MKDEKRKELFKSILRITAIGICVITALYLVTLGVKAIFRKKTPTRVVDDSIRFSAADYELDIFSDPLYVSKERNITWTENGVTELLGEKCPAEQTWHGVADESYYYAAGAEQAFFRSFFICLIKGEYKEYPAFFTSGFFKNYTVPDIFTPQKIYDISVEVQNRKPDDSGETVYSTFIVRYKIMNNNGTYRGDVASDMIHPLVFTTVYKNGGIQIESIVFLNGKYQGGQ